VVAADCQRTFISAIALLPIANVVAISQTAPLVLTAVAARFLGERVDRRRWLATLAGFGGVLCIVKPGTSAFSWWSLLALGTMISIVVRDVATRRMDPTIPATLITLSTAFGVMLSGFGLSAIEGGWQVPTSWGWFCLAGAALFIALAYYFAIQAVRTAELSVIAPFRYTIVPMSVLAGWLVWREVPDWPSLLGMGIIAVAGVVTYRGRGAGR
jgi:drug/metabolite transporter (DMT)-like permease